MAIAAAYVGADAANSEVIHMRKTEFIGVAIICTVSLLACGKTDAIQYTQKMKSSISKNQQINDAIEEELPIPTPAETEEETSMQPEPGETKSSQFQWQIYIQPDMPEPFVEVLKQYENFMNADLQDLNDENVRKKIESIDGEWRYLYDELCGGWMSAVRYHGEEANVIRYSLEDLTGDGFPELIMGYHLSDDRVIPEVVYYYSQTEGIKMECLSSYYTMVLYAGGVIEYISGGVTYTETYCQFQEETESWELAVRVVVDWDYKTDSVNGYYWGDNVASLFDNEPMSEEEYQEIIQRYASDPVEPEWIPLVLSVESVRGYFFPQGVTNRIYVASFADFWPQQEEVKVELHITEAQIFEEGTLYELKIESDVEAPDTHAGYRGDWRNFGLFYVQEDEIYFIRADEAKSEYQTVEEILNASILVCSEAGEEDALDKDERGWHEFILVDGDRREYHGYSTWMETGYYEHFYWEKGKGLAMYESGYGAEANGIKMYLAE